MYAWVHGYSKFIRDKEKQNHGGQIRSVTDEQRNMEG